jgi:hypothetical protein
VHGETLERRTRQSGLSGLTRAGHEIHPFESGMTSPFWAAGGVAGPRLGNSPVMVSPKVTSLTLAAMVAVGCCTAAASTLTPANSKSPAAAPTASCHPTSAKGHCYAPGEFCRKSDLGKSGVAADGAKITCKYHDGRYRWERV